MEHWAANLLKQDASNYSLKHKPEGASKPVQFWRQRLPCSLCGVPPAACPGVQRLHCGEHVGCGPARPQLLQLLPDGASMPEPLPDAHGCRDVHAREHSRWGAISMLPGQRSAPARRTVSETLHRSEIDEQSTTIFGENSRGKGRRRSGFWLGRAAASQKSTKPPGALADTMARRQWRWQLVTRGSLPIWTRLLPGGFRGCFC